MTQKPKAKPTCFVIQDFDGSTYERRYNESIKPALERAGVEPQRADIILGQTPNFPKMVEAILGSNFCIAEVSENNPMVWLELGCALIHAQYVIVLCDKSKRLKLPFDFKQLPIIFYRSDSKSGYQQLEADITKLVNSEINKLLLGKNKYFKEYEDVNDNEDIPF